MCNLTQTTKVVKEFDEKSLYFLKFALQDEAQHIIRECLPAYRRKDYCNCHRLSIKPSLTSQVLLNNETRRAYYHRVVTCSNATLCPVCAPRISAFRCDEISKASMLHLKADPDNALYLLTLTCRHSSANYLPSLLSSFKRAMSYFFGRSDVQHFFLSLGVIGRITAHEVTYSDLSGYHPHCHILLFGKRSFCSAAYISSLWLKCLQKHGLDGLDGIALQFQPADNVKNYLTKISQEMVLFHLKHGRTNGHFTPMQLLNEASCGEVWARTAFATIFSAYYGKHLLHWSKGLKSRFGIKTVTDDDITSNDAEAQKFSLILEIPFKIFNSLSHYKRAEILGKVSHGDYSSLRDWLVLNKKYIPVL